MEDIHRVQKAFAIPDTELRDTLREDNKQFIMPYYRAFLQRYRTLPFTRNHDKYIKYSEQDVCRFIDGFFDAASWTATAISSCRGDHKSEKLRKLKPIGWVLCNSWCRNKDRFIIIIIIVIKNECHSNIIVSRHQGCGHSKKLRESESESRSSKVFWQAWFQL